MPTVKAFLKTLPVLTYFVLTFLFSWLGILIVLGPGGFTGNAEPTDASLPFVYLAMFAGPSLAGVLLTALTDGREGLRSLLSRLLRWRVGARWYAIALLTAPLSITAVLLVLSQVSPAFVPGIIASEDKTSLLLGGLAAGLSTGFFEELGWTGFAVPRLRLRYAVLATGLIVGLSWGAWHFPLFSSGDPSRALPRALYLPGLLFTFLPAFRVLMVWVYDRTGSLLLAMLMHVSLTASALILQPLEVAGVPALCYNLALAAVLWVVAAAVAVANGGQLSRQARPRQVV